MSKINDFLNEAGVFFLATVDGDKPRLRPLGAHMEMDGKEIFGIGDFKAVYKQMVANANVEIVACKQDGHWMRYTGKSVVETDNKYAEYDRMSENEKSGLKDSLERVLKDNSDILENDLKNYEEALKTVI